MILHTQTPVVDETDGLPLPHRIWAVVGISFALCMSVLCLLYTSDAADE